LQQNKSGHIYVDLRNEKSKHTYWFAQRKIYLEIATIFQKQ